MHKYLLIYVPNGSGSISLVFSRLLKKYDLVQATKQPFHGACQPVYERFRFRTNNFIDYSHGIFNWKLEHVS